MVNIINRIWTADVMSMRVSHVTAKYEIIDEGILTDEY